MLLSWFDICVATTSRVLIVTSVDAILKPNKLSQHTNSVGHAHMQMLTGNGCAPSRHSHPHHWAARHTLQCTCS